MKESDASLKFNEVKDDPKQLPVPKMVVVTVLLLTLLIILGFCGATLREKQLQSRNYVLHSLSTLRQIHSVRTTIKEAEISRHCYALTRDERFHNDFDALTSSLQPQLDSLKALAGDDPRQSNLDDQFERIVHEKVAEQKHSVELIAGGHLDEAKAEVESMHGKNLLGEVRKSAGVMMDEEALELEERTSLISQQAEKMGLVMVALTTMATGSLFVILWLVWRWYRVRQNAFEIRQQAADMQSKANAQVEASEHRFRQMAQNINDIFWITDARTRAPVYVSPAYEEIYQRSLDELFKNPNQFLETCHPDDRGRLAEAIKTQRENGATTAIEYRIVRPSGEVRWIWSRIGSIRDEDGTLSGFCGITSDITARKESEARISEFYSTVSHELRTPLTSIRGSLGLIEGGITGEIPPMAMELVQIGCVESDRLIRLINDILDIKKIETRMFDLNIGPVDVENLVSTTLDAIRGMALSNEISLESSVSTSRPMVGDKERLVQVLTNLISNAIKFSPTGATVKVAAGEGPAESVRFEVIDNGPGIPREQRHKLFQMFQQLDSSDTRQVGGTGLGLAISKSIVEIHGGTIGVDSEAGKGSTFWFEIPLKKVGAESKTDFSPDKSDSATKAREMQSRARVLVVEDDSATAEITRRQLATIGIECLIAVDGREALKLLSGDPFDLLILDVEIPYIDGFQLVEQLSKEEKKMPLIVYSNHDLTREEKKRLRLGPTEHLVKTRTSHRQFLASVQTALGNGSGRTAALSGPMTI